MATADETIQASAVRTSACWFDVKAAIRRAIQSDEYASLAGEPGTALGDLRDELLLHIRDIDELVTHQHQWNDDDRCSICGADGRA